jgi:hypothetical protein
VLLAFGARRPGELHRRSPRTPNMLKPARKPAQPKRDERPRSEERRRSSPTSRSFAVRPQAPFSANHSAPFATGSVFLVSKWGEGTSPHLPPEHSPLATRPRQAIRPSRACRNREAFTPSHPRERFTPSHPRERFPRTPLCSIGSREPSRPEVRSVASGSPR